jgi:hypothetical protein
VTLGEVVAALVLVILVTSAWPWIRAARFPRRIVQCPKCFHRFDADSDVLYFAFLGLLMGLLLASLACR